MRLTMDSNSGPHTFSTARSKAIKASAEFAVKPTAIVSYQSQGKVLLIGPASSLASIIGNIPELLRPFFLLTTNLSAELRNVFDRAGISFIEAVEKIDVEGYLGDFFVSGWSENRPMSVNETLLSPDIGFDLVLDLQQAPSINRTTLPIGYFIIEKGSQQIEPLFSRCTELVGEFEKPKYFQLTDALCAHDRNAINGCRQCIDVCPAEAISSKNEKIQIDPFLCQGCGDCTTVCPAGAVNYQYPTRTDTINRLRLLLETYFEAGGIDPVLVFHDEADGIWLNQKHDDFPDHILPYSLESLSSVGIDIWLTALAFGANAVKLLKFDRLGESAERLLNSQLTYAREILSAMGFDSGCTGWISKQELASPISPKQIEKKFLRARFAGTDEKRRIIRMAVDHLREQAGSKIISIPLNNGAPFGELEINSDACTLCMSCVSICPEGALSDGVEQPQLKFFEANCVQCGLCANVCPENAVTLRPRFLYEGDQARRARVLHEEKVFNCIRCGRGFASESMIRKITEKLEGHPMFQGENGDRLKMCEDCRVTSQFDR